MRGARRSSSTCRALVGRVRRGACATPALPVGPERAARFADALAVVRPSPAGGCTGPRARCSSPTGPRCRRSTPCSPRCSAGGRVGAASDAEADAEPSADDRARRPAARGAERAAADALDAEERGRASARPALGTGDAEPSSTDAPGADRWPATRRCCAASASTRSSPTSWRSCTRLMAELALATPRRRTRRSERRRHGERDRPAPHAARQPAHRRRPGPPGPARRRDRAPADRAAVRHLGLDGALRPRLPAVPGLRRGGRAAGRGVRVRHPADPADPRAALAQPRPGDPARARPRRRTGPAAPGSATR